MKSGIELIAQERQEQIEKHGRTIDHDLEANTFHQLSDAAALLCGVPTELLYDEQPIPKDYAPFNWELATFRKMMDKDYIDRLVIAGALIAAEIDRLNATENTIP